MNPDFSNISIADCTVVYFILKIIESPTLRNIYKEKCEQYLHKYFHTFATDDDRDVEKHYASEQGLTSGLSLCININPFVEFRNPIWLRTWTARFNPLSPVADCTSCLIQPRAYESRWSSNCERGDPWDVTRLLSDWLLSVGFKTERKAADSQWMWSEIVYITERTADHLI